MDRREFITGSAATMAVGFSPRVHPALPTSPSFKVGFAERDITPDLGTEQPGSYEKVFHKTFHDPCKVRVAVFDDGRSRVALVGVDALMVPRQLVVATRQAIKQRCGIDGRAILIGASHSHSSGPTGMIQPGQYDHSSQLVRQLAYQFSSRADAKYLERVQNEIVSAVCHADSFRVEASCSFGFGVEDKVAFNRRLRMKYGLTFTHPGQGNPNILDFSGPIDPEVGVIGAWDANGQLIGCVVNFACHATTNPGGISANWVYYLEQVIRGALAPQATVVFLQGASGDVTQVNNLSPSANPNGEEWCQFVGGRIGAEAVKVLLSSPAGDEFPISAKSRIFHIRRRVPSPARVQRCYELVKKDPTKVGATQWTFAKEIVLLDALLIKEPTAEVEVQAIQVGPAVLLTNPAELFCQFGLEMKKKSPFLFTFPVELANGCVGYVPTEEAFGEHGGGYETRLTSYSNLAVSAGRQMVTAALELTGDMIPGRVPEEPKAQSFREAWSYGNVPPELD